MRLHLDTPLEGAAIRGAALHVQGWAYDENSPVRRVVVLVDGRPVARATLGWARPDVAERYADPRMGLCGFDRVVTLPPELRTPGPHTVAVRARLMDGRRRRTPEVRVDLPEDVLLPDEPVAAVRPATGAIIRSVWLARSLDRGGSQLRMAETIDHLLRSGGWSVTVLSPVDGLLRERLERAGATVRLVDPVPFDDAAAYRVAVKGLADELADADLAVAFTVTSFPLVDAARLAGVPAVQRIGESAPLPTVAAWLLGHLDPDVEARARRAVRGAAAIWTNSHAVERVYRRQGYDGPWRVLHTGRPDVGNPPARAEARRRLGIPSDRRLLVFAGTIWPVKGQGLLAEAVRVVHEEVPDLMVAMVGYDGNAHATHLRDHVAAHDLADTVVVAPFHDDLGTWWAAADGVALTPTRQSEALSAALVEGMAHGLPALATLAGDADVMVEDGVSGWLAEPDDLDSLVDALRRAGAADPATWRRYGDQAALRCAREHDREGALVEAEALLRESARTP